jgi:CheY-like chemotaxis protein
LAIESNWRIRKLIRANLEPLGLHVLEAVDQQHGLECIREQRPDLILLDLDLPDAEAVRLLQDLHYHHEIPTVIMSAEPLSREFMQSDVVDGHLIKPFAAPALLEQVQKVLGNLKNSNRAT